MSFTSGGPRPERHQKPKCPEMQSAGMLSYACELPEGHMQVNPSDPEPHYATEVDRTVRAWQAWQARQVEVLAQDEQEPGDLACPVCKSGRMTLVEHEGVGTYGHCDNVDCSATISLATAQGGNEPSADGIIAPVEGSVDWLVEQTNQPAIDPEKVAAIREQYVDKPAAPGEDNVVPDTPEGAAAILPDGPVPDIDTFDPHSLQPQHFDDGVLRTIPADPHLEAIPEVPEAFRQPVVESPNETRLNTMLAETLAPYIDPEHVPLAVEEVKATFTRFVLEA